MRVACAWDFLQVDDDYYINKEDSYRSAIENIAKQHEVHCFCLSQDLDAIRGPHNRVYYHHATSVEKLMLQMVNYDPYLIIMSGFGMPITKEVCAKLPEARRLLIFVGGAIRVPQENMDWIMISSEEMKQGMVKLGYPAEKIIVCSYGVNPDLFKPDGRVKMFDVIYTADWRENKRQELLLKAIASLTGVTCLIIGAQSGMYNKDYFKKMLLLAEKLDILDRLYCVNRVPGKCLPIWYQSSKIGIHLGLPAEGGARSPLEAMSCELPVIVTADCMSNTSRIEHMTEGLHVPPEPSKIAEAINHLLSDGKLREKMGENARKKVIEKFHEKKMEQVFRECMSAERRTNKMKKKKVYLFGFFGDGFLTDEAIRESTESLIRRIDPEIKIDSIITRQIFSDTVCSSNDEIKNVVDILNAEYDLVIFCGGTWLGKIRIQFANTVNKWHKTLRIPYILYGSGYRNESESLSSEDKEFLSLLLENAHKIGIRGKDSFQKLQNEGFDVSKFHAVGDPTFSFQSSDIDERECSRALKGDSFLGMNSRIILEVEQHQASCHNDWIRWEWLAKTYNYLFENEGFRSFINFPLTVSSKSYYSDQKAFHALKFHLRPEISPRECYINLLPMLRGIGKARFNVGERLHFQLMSLVHGVPFLPIEYEFEKLSDALSIHPAFDIFRENIISMNDALTLPYGGDMYDIYLKVKAANGQVIRAAVDNIRDEQEKWIRQVLGEVM